MGEDSLLENIISHKDTIYQSRHVLLNDFIPEKLPHREQEITLIASTLIEIIRDKKGVTNNILCFGKTGTGKTAVARHLCNHLQKIGEKYKQDVIPIYLRKVSSESTLYADVSNLIAPEQHTPDRGIPTEKIFEKMRNNIDKKTQRIILIIDEIDSACKKHGDNFLYNLTRINTDLKQSSLCFIGITNDLKFGEHLDPRVKSSMHADEIIFSPYNAAQLQDILKQRAEIAFKTNTLHSNVISLCAALSAQEHGDARKAFDLLRTAGDLAVRQQDTKITEDHIRRAQNKIALDKITETISALPIQSRLVLMTILLNKENSHAVFTTGELYGAYKAVAIKIGVVPLHQRRIVDLIGELDMLGIINARVISYGRGGRTREITPAAPVSAMKETLLQDETLSPLRNYKPPHPGRGRGGFF